MPIIELFLAFSDNALLYYPNLFVAIVPMILLVCLYYLIKMTLVFLYVLDRVIKAELRKTRTQRLTVGELDTSVRGSTLDPRAYDRSIVVRVKINVRKKAFVKKYRKFYLFISFWVKTIRVRTEEIMRRLKKEIFIEG